MTLGQWLLMQQISDQQGGGTGGGQPTPTQGTWAQYVQALVNAPGNQIPNVPPNAPGQAPDSSLPPPAVDPTSNPPTTAPYNPAFETPNVQPSPTPTLNSWFNPAPYENPQAGAQGASVYQQPDVTNPPPAQSISTTPFDYYQYDNPPPAEDTSPSDVSVYQPPDWQNIPTQEAMAPTVADQYIGADPYNPPTNESMLPTPADTYIPPDLTNPPPNETMLPTPADVYQSPDLTNPVPTESEFATPPTVDTYQYPDGQGGYTSLDLGGGQPAASDTSALGPDFTVVSALPYDPSQPQNFSPDPTVSAQNLPPLPGSFAGLGSFSAGQLTPTESMMGGFHSPEFQSWLQQNYPGWTLAQYMAYLNSQSTTTTDTSGSSPQNESVQQSTTDTGGSTGRTAPPKAAS